MSEAEKEPRQKLVVDEDWKAQVEQEKAAVRAQREQQSTPPAAGEAASAADDSASATPPPDAAAASGPPSDQPIASGPPSDQPIASEAAAPQQPAPQQPAPQQPAPQQAEREAAGAAPPPASFSLLVSMLFTQAIAALGQVPDPDTGKPTIDRPLAKHYIDTLGMLEEKTRGNLDSQESQMLSEALHALRMAFVSTNVG